jgi:hypothetical protein
MCEKLGICQQQIILKEVVNCSNRICLKSLGDFMPKMGKVTCSSETSLDFYRNTRRYIPETRHSHRCENLKSN